MNRLAQKEVAALAAKAPGGLLKPEDVLTFARDNPESALHAEFEWNDGEAARLFRLDQARQIIRLCLIRLPDRPRKVRAYLSVPTDRVEGGGYRQTVDVLNDAAYRRQVAEDVFNRVLNVLRACAIFPELRSFALDIEKVVLQHRVLLDQREEAG